MRRFAGLLVMLCAARAAVACSCIAPRSVADEIESATAIFAGRVVAIEDLAQEKLDALPESERRASWTAAIDRHHQLGAWGPDWGRKVTFEVTTTWKGEPAQTVDVWTGQGGGDCGYSFERGYTYVVFAKERRGLLQTGICVGTTPLLCARDTLAALGEPRLAAQPDEAPYPLERFPCLSWPQLLTERGLEQLLAHSGASVNLLVDREGRVADFAFAEPNGCFRCSDEKKRAIEERVHAWRFRPAYYNGLPVAVRIRQISSRSPQTESEAKERECH